MTSTALGRPSRVAPLIHDIFGAIYKPSVKRLYQAGAQMRGRDQPGADPSYPESSPTSEDGSPAPSAKPPLVSTSLQSISIALETAVAEHIFESARFARESSVAFSTPLP